MNAASFSVKRSNSRWPLKSRQMPSAPILACTARTLGVTATSRNPYDTAVLLRAPEGGLTTGNSRQPPLASGRVACAEDRKVDVGLRDHVEQVREDVLGGDGKDLHDLAVAEAGVPDRLDVGLGDVSALTHDLGRETHGGIRLRVARLALTIEGDLLGADLGEVQAKIAVCREAVVATVHLRDGQCDPLARLDVERLRQRAIIGRETLQRGRALGDQAVHVRDDSEMLVHG